MKQEALIKIKGIQRAGGDDDVVELLTTGSFAREEGCYIISYEESEATGFEGALTTLRYEEEAGRVTLTRSGAVRSHLIVEAGERNIGHYGTAGGELIIGVNTRLIRSSLTDAGGDLRFSYSLDVNSSLVSENEVYVNVKECETPS